MQKFAHFKRNPLGVGGLGLIVLLFVLGLAALETTPSAEALGGITANFEADGTATGTWNNDQGGPCSNNSGVRWYIGINWDVSDDVSGDSFDADNQDYLEPVVCGDYPDWGPVDPANYGSPELIGSCATLYHAPNANIQGADIADTTCAGEPPPADVCPNIDGVQETLPDGYILDSQGNCVVPFTVHKDFDDDNTATVSISLSCSGATVDNSPQDATDEDAGGSAAVFNLSGVTDGATCSASESNVPAGYSTDNSACQDVAVTDTECTITNTLIPVSLASITIVKNVPGTDSQNFSFSDNISGCSIGTLDDDPSSSTPKSVTCSNVTPGTYTVSENVPSDWFLDDIHCSGSGDWNVDVNDEEVSITVASGESVTCTFENDPAEEEFVPTPAPTQQVLAAVATPTPSPTTSPSPIAEVEAVALPSAGSGGPSQTSSVWMFIAATLLLGTGSAFAVVSRRRVK